MKRLLQLISYLGLALSLVPAFFLFHGSISVETYRALILIGLFLWFGPAIAWIRPPKRDHS